MGDISFACFEVAKIVKKNPADVARELAASIAPNEIVKETRAVGPYVNFFIKDEVLFESIVQRAEEAGEKAGERVIRLVPPLIITKKQIDDFVREFQKTIIASA